MATHNIIYIAPSHTKKVFANMKRQGKDFSGRVTPLFSTMMVQAQQEQGEGFQSRRSNRKDNEVPQPSDPTNVADEDSMTLNEMMDFCTKLQQRVLDLENTKTAQAQEITSLKLRVKKLEKKGGSRTYKLKRLYKVGRSPRIVSSHEASLGDQEDASKQGRKIDDIDADVGSNLVSTHFDADTDMFGVHDLVGDEVVVKREVVAMKKDDEVNIVKEVVTTTKGILLQEPSESITTTTTIPSKDKVKEYARWKPKDLKNKSFANIQELFDKAMKRVNTFVDVETELVEGSEVRAEGSETREEISSKRAGDELE
ncbi:hypothetical protein Tco_1404156 [Tanacetum coccineum]